MNRLDCRGMTCPNPVIKTKNLVDDGANEVSVVVDNEAASINVNNFLTSQGFETKVESNGPDYVVSGHQSSQLEPEQCRVMPIQTEAATKTLALICSDRIGKGDDDLGRGLMVAFLSTLKEMGNELWRVVLLNSAVKMTVQDSDCIEPLKELGQSGVSILVCGTCLNHYDLFNDKQVGETTNMLDVVTSMQVADKVISMT